MLNTMTNSFTTSYASLHLLGKNMLSSLGKSLKDVCKGYFVNE
jgi:hypothetical protein